MKISFLIKERRGTNEDSLISRPISNSMLVTMVSDSFKEKATTTTTNNNYYYYNY